MGEFLRRHSWFGQSVAGNAAWEIIKGAVSILLPGTVMLNLKHQAVLALFGAHEELSLLVLGIAMCLVAQGIYRLAGSLFRIFRRYRESRRVKPGLILPADLERIVRDAVESASKPASESLDELREAIAAREKEYEETVATLRAALSEKTNSEVRIAGQVESIPANQESFNRLRELHQVADEAFKFGEECVFTCLMHEAYQNGDPTQKMIVDLMDGFMKRPYREARAELRALVDRRDLSTAADLELLVRAFQRSIISRSCFLGKSNRSDLLLQHVSLTAGLHRTAVRA